ncbi:MAG: hypothetical protein WD355_07780 [Balneolaceae bacterium]
MRKIIVGFVLLYSLFITSCDDFFEPWQENNKYHFSIYGYLDASADTQWVRIMPIREDLLLEPGPIDAIVTLEHVETGESVIMNDSLFAYAHEAYAYNFWTTMKLKAEQTYRITATRSDGASSHVQTSLPTDFPTPSIHITFRWPRSCCSPVFALPENVVIYIEHVERLADVLTIYHSRYPESGENYLVARPQLQHSFPVVSGGFQVVIDPTKDYQFLDMFYRLDPEVVFERYLHPSSPYEPQIFIASAGPDYHHFPSIDEKVVALPEGISNVVNGTGYLAGIISKTIPYKNCYRGETRIVEPCNELLPPPAW